jgi:hypothetical protein
MEEANVFPNKTNTYNAFMVDYNLNKFTIYDLPFAECFKHDCNITYNSGGSIRLFAESADRVNRTFNKVVIEGPCISACTGFAELANSHVCILSSTSFLYHTDNFDKIPDYYSEWTLKWIYKQGGLPRYKTHKLITMIYKEAKEHWQTCSWLDLTSVRSFKNTKSKYLDLQNIVKLKDISNIRIFSKKVEGYTFTWFTRSE